MKLKIFILIIIGTIFAVNAVLADTADLTCENNPSAYPWCQAATNGPGGLVNNFYKIALGLAAASAMGVLIYGAILWTVSGAVATKKDAMDWIWGAIWGFVLLIAAYLILYTINPNLVNLPSTEQLIGPLKASGQVLPGTTFPPAPTPSGVRLGEDLTRTQLNQNNIVAKPACTSGQSVDCVNLDGIRQDTVNELIWLHQACPNCNLFITGGTEPGHENGVYSHTNGYKADLRLDSGLATFITTNCNYSFTRSDGAVVYTNPITGGQYALENNHWDIFVP